MIITFTNVIGAIRNAISSVITTNLKMWLGFETSSIDGDEQITPDKSGNNNVGELFTGKALDFNGSTDYVNTTGFEMSGTSATFAFWVYPKDTAYQFIMDLDGTVRTILGLYNGGSGQVFAFFNFGFKQFGTPIQNQWQRVVFRLNATTVECYVDGVKSGSTLALTSPIDLSTVGNSVIGGRFDTTNAANRFDGSLSDFQIYNAYWSTDDIAFDYANPNKLAIDNPSTSLSVTNLKGYWAMSEGDGLVAYDSGTNLEEEEVVNGDFATDSDWSEGAGWDIDEANNRITRTAQGGSTSASQNISFVSGKSYSITYTLDVSAGSFLIRLGGDGVKDTPARSLDDTYTEVVTASGNYTTLNLRALDGTFAGSISNVSVREVTASDHGGLINGSTYVDAQPRIPQLGMQNWAKSTPVADEITLIPNPTIPTQDILGNAVRDRLNSFNLDGSGYAEVADNADLDFGTGDFTLECWLRIDGNTLRRLLDKRNTTSGYTLYLTNLNVLNLELNDGTGNSGFILTSSLSSNTWLHLAIVCDRSANATCYVNKAAQTPVNISSKGGNIDSTSNLIIGADAPDGLSLFSTDIISDVRLYKGKALSATEIENNYNAGLSAHTNN